MYSDDFTVKKKVRANNLWFILTVSIFIPVAVIIMLFFIPPMKDNMEIDIAVEILLISFICLVYIFFSTLYNLFAIYCTTINFVKNPVLWVLGFLVPLLNLVVLVMAFIVYPMQSNTVIEEWEKEGTYQNVEKLHVGRLLFALVLWLLVVAILDYLRMESTLFKLFSYILVASIPSLLVWRDLKNWSQYPVA